MSMQTWHLMIQPTLIFWIKQQVLMNRATMIQITIVILNWTSALLRLTAHEDMSLLMIMIMSFMTKLVISLSKAT